MEIYAIEYSPSQKAFHVDILQDTILVNLRAIERYTEKKIDLPDFILVGIAYSQEEANVLMDTIREKYKI